MVDSLRVIRIFALIALVATNSCCGYDSTDRNPSNENIGSNNVQDIGRQDELTEEDFQTLVEKPVEELDPQYDSFREKAERVKRWVPLAVGAVRVGAVVISRVGPKIISLVRGVGPSGKLMVHTKLYPSRKAAQEAARNLGKGSPPIHHRGSPGSNPHFHPSKPGPNNKGYIKRCDGVHCYYKP